MPSRCWRVLRSDEPWYVKKEEEERDAIICISNSRSDTGELLVRLPTDGAAELTLLRNPQQDMAVAIDFTRSEKDVPDALAEMLKTLMSTTTIRKLAFNSFNDLLTYY